MSSPKRSDWTVNVRRLDAPQIPDRPFLVEVRRPNGEKYAGKKDREHVIALPIERGQQHRTRAERGGDQNNSIRRRGVRLALGRAREANALGLGLGPDAAQGGLDDARRVDGHIFDVELAGFDLGEVENVVDDGEQQLARVEDAAEGLLGLAPGAVPEADLGEAQHPVEGRADLVAHAGQKGALLDDLLLSSVAGP